MDERRRAHLRRIAPLGGRARAAQLTPARRKEIAALGFAAMVRRYFAGDRSTAIEWLVSKNLFINDPCPWNGVYRDPGPFPAPVAPNSKGD